MFRIVLVLGVTLGLAVQAAPANLLINGDFEDGPTQNIADGVPGWNVWGGNGWHHDDAGRVIDTKAIKFWWDQSGMWQDFPVVAGEEYTFSVQTLNSTLETLIHWNGLIKAEFYDSSVGTDPGDALLNLDLDKYLSASDPVDEWIEIGGAVTAPANANVGRIVLLLVDWQDGAGGSLNFDNALVTPEPATMLLLGVGGVLALRRRRG